MRSLCGELNAALLFVAVSDQNCTDYRAGTCRVAGSINDFVVGVKES